MLVAIASHGEKNLPFLKRLIENYQSLPMDVDIVVVSNGPKDLGPDVRVVVGLPSANPWSLPFAHKPIFAENQDRYDLFIYSEDDMEVAERHIRAFLQVTPALADDEIAGFLRYEVDGNGAWHVPEAHESAHWKPETAKRRGPHSVAEFSNEHAGVYLLTQSQLKQVVASGNFLRKPYEGRYGLPETAATDPYTCCGFRKVICVSFLQDFLIHHLPDRYIGQLGTPLSVIQEQAKTLVNISNGVHPATMLCPVESKCMRGRWSRDYDEKPRAELLAALPAGARTILSVGCGSGRLEAAFAERGMKVTALPLDSVAGAAVSRRGIEVVYGTWREGFLQLADRKFDGVVVAGLFHLLPDPGPLLAACAASLADGGTLLASGPNFGRFPHRIKQALGINGYRGLRDYSESGINVNVTRELSESARRLGLDPVKLLWLDHELAPGRRGVSLGGLTARNWLLEARRKPAMAAGGTI